MNRNKKSAIAVLLIISLFILAAASGCSSQNGTAQAPKNQTLTEPISKSEFLLDTMCKISVYDNVSPEVIDKGFDKLKEVDARMNADSETSEIADINSHAGLDYVKVSDETFYVIKEGKQYGDTTHGRFDITIGPLVKLWGINTDHARVPAPEEIKEKLPLVDYHNILLDEANKKVMLTNKGMALDLGGIAKGYSADAVAEVLKKNGVEHAIINLGGNVLVMGSKPGGEDWKVGIQNPLAERGEYMGIVHVSDKAVVTSGIYERFFEQDGKRYHHILDTNTGYPVDNSLAGVTIVTDKSIDGDALAKAFCMGVEEGLKFIEAQKNAEAIFVTKDSKVYVTPGIKKSFEITDASFTLMN